MASGTINANQYRYLLWTNSHPGYMNAGDVIELDPVIDYDQLEFEMKLVGSDQYSYIVVVGKPAGDFQASIVNGDPVNLTDNFICARKFTYVNAHKFTAAANGVVARLTQQMALGNNFAVPQKIYGIKYG